MSLNVHVLFCVCICIFLYKWEYVFVLICIFTLSENAIKNVIKLLTNKIFKKMALKLEPCLLMGSGKTNSVAGSSTHCHTPFDKNEIFLEFIFFMYRIINTDVMIWYYKQHLLQNVTFFKRMAVETFTVNGLHEFHVKISNLL